MLEQIFNLNEAIKIDIPFMKLSDNAVIPMYATDGDAGMDLFTLEDTIVKAGDTVTIPTGIAMALPKFLKATVRPRSGNTLKGVKGYKTVPAVMTVTGSIGLNTAPAVASDYVNPVKERVATIQNCMPYLRVQIGTIDAGYRGDIGIITYNQEDYDVLVPKGTKLAQLVVDFNIQGTLKETEELPTSERGTGSYGHTDEQK